MEPGAGARLESPKTEEARREVEALRARAAEIEAQLLSQGVPQEHAPKAAAEQAVAEKWSREAPAQKTVDAQTAGQPEAIQLKLAPEEHDAKMREFVHLLQEKGVGRAIQAVEHSGNPHLIDDFHRILVEWVHEGLPAKGSDSPSYAVPLHMTLFEVTLPQAGVEKNLPPDPTKVMRDFIALMEQFYRGMLQMDARHGEYFSFEIANPVGAVHTTVYIAVPAIRKEMMQKQLLSLYPAARVVETHEDYNAFADGAETVAAYATQKERHIYSLRTFETFPNDPLDTLLNAFSKLDEAGEGAAVQFVVAPKDYGLLKRYRYALERIHLGVPIRKATYIPRGFMRVLHELWSIFVTPKKLDPDKRPKPDDPHVKNIERKVSSPILLADIRITASSVRAGRARGILDDIRAAFQQFADTGGNTLEFRDIPPRRLTHFARQFSYRLLDKKTAMPLSALELATLAHLPRPKAREAAPELRQDRSQAAAAPVGLPQQGTLLGINRFRGGETKVYIQPEDRLRHFYLIGQTGTGKSALLKNIVAQDIQGGAGVCFIDPHGTDVLDVLSVIPRERMEDVIYFDPAHVERPMGLNMMEYDPAHPEQKTLVVDELLGIFKKLFGQVPESMGPAFEQYFRNAALLTMEAPELGNTLLDVSRIFGDAEFRARKLAACKNPVVRRFWEDIAMKASGEQGLENYAPYVTNKFDAFTTNEIVRPIIAQQKSALNFRDIMDSRKILLVNLSKGRIGDLNANLLGLVIVGKFLIAALSRADSFGKDLPPFYLHIDEFQNFATPSIATILSEARKYKLSLTVAHQFIKQLSEDIRNAVFGNVGSMCAFRVGAEDGEFLEKQFAPIFTLNDLIRIDNFHAHLKLLVGGKPAAPFNIETLPFQGGTMEHVARMQELSFLKYGRPREEIEAEIADGLGTMRQEPATLAQGGV